MAQGVNTLLGLKCINKYFMGMSAKMDKESAFADLIGDHENRWVAIIEKDGVEFIVGTGNTAVEAVKEATAKGYPQAVLFKVPSFKARPIF
jgi:hypothetical protein